jgi:branched-chain amino acid transport system substrate-binding protein
MSPGRFVRRRPVALAALSLIVLPLAACGTRESHATLVQALRGGTVVANSTTGTSGGAVSPTGTTPTGSSGSNVGGGSSPVTGSGNSGGSSPVTGSGNSGGSSPVTGAGNGGGGGSSSTGGGKSGSGKSGGGKKSTGTNGSAPTGTNALVPGVQSCTKQLSPVVIGSVGEQSGLAGAAVAAGAQTVAAWAAYVNSLGGLRCHQIKFIAADDGASPAQNASLTEQLVQSDHVAAFVYNDAPLAAAGSENYLIAHRIPIVGNEGAEQFMYNEPFFFPQASNGSSLVYVDYAGIAGQLTASQRQHFGVISCLEAAECSVFGKYATQYTHDVGMKLVYNASASLTAPDYTSQCLKAKQDGVQALELVLDPNSIHRAAANCRSVGYNGIFTTGSTVVIADEATDPNLQNMVFGAPTEVWTDTANPQISLMRNTLAKYSPGTSPVGSAGLGWTAAQLFAYSSTFWPTTNTITSADIITAMDKVKNYDVGGMTGPLTYTAGHTAPLVTCWFQAAVRSDKFVSPNGGKRSCR